jgi:hypothetical protein
MFTITQSRLHLAHLGRHGMQLPNNVDLGGTRVTLCTSTLTCRTSTITRALCASIFQHSATQPERLHGAGSLLRRLYARTGTCSCSRLDRLDVAASWSHRGTTIVSLQGKTFLFPTRDKAQIDQVSMPCSQRLSTALLRRSCWQPIDRLNEQTCPWPPLQHEETC